MSADAYPNLRDFARILGECAPLEIAEAGDENTCATFTCPTCGGDGALDAEQVLELHGSPREFPTGFVGIQFFGVGEGHQRMCGILHKVPGEAAAIMDDLAAANTAHVSSLAAHVADVRQFQDDVRSMLLGLLADRHIRADIDGGGCDSGDWRDFTLSEIRQAFNAIAYHHHEGCRP